MVKFNKKIDAIQYHKKYKKDNMLFQEDIDRAGTKCFHVCKSSDIFDRIGTLEQPHYYEFWTDITKIVFAVDIDYDRTKSDIEPIELIKKVIKIVRKGAQDYYSHNYKIEDIIVLENCEQSQKLDNPNKYSSHIIFRGLNFNNHLVAKDFYLRLKKDYKISDYFVDEHIYNQTCLRLFLNSKMSKNAVLIQKTIIIEDQQTMIPERSKDGLYQFFLKTLITHTLPKDNTITDIKCIKVQNEINKLDKKNEYLSNIDNINVEKILDELPHNYCDDYITWVQAGMILNKYDLYETWYNWSSKSSKFKPQEMESKWRSFTNGKNGFSIGTLIKWAQNENIEDIYINPNITKTEIAVNTYPVKPINLKMNNKLISQAKLTPDIYEGLLNKRLLCVQSEKGTGKTSNLLESLFKTDDGLNLINESTSILFLSSRVTFGIKLYGDLKEYGFELYSQVNEHYISSKRIICQIDSLMRLDTENFDIVIIDECESLARYITSTHFTKNPKASLVMSCFEYMVSNSKHTYILDADLSDRCLNYYSNVIDCNQNDIYIIQNDFKAYSEYELLCCQYSTWARQILLKLEDNKRLAIAMASNSKAKDLAEYINQKFQSENKKVLLINREMSESEKRSLLQNVNSNWNKYDVVIYTPSVCMGVSFDIESYFDYIFAYGCHESLGSQEWCQMIHRVRSPVNKQIYVAIDKYNPYNESDDIISYGDVERLLCSDYYLTHYDLHTNIIPKKMKKDEKNEREIVYPYKDEPIYDLYIRNCQEIIENKLNFTASFFGYAKFKEYKMSFLPETPEDIEISKELKEIKEEREEEEKDKLIEGIKNAPIIDSDTYKEKVKQRDEFITEEDKYAMHKHRIIKCYHLDKKTDEEINTILDDEFIDKYHSRDMMKWYNNLTAIMNTDNQKTEEKLNILKENEKFISSYSSCYADFTNHNKYSYHYYAQEIIKQMGFNINNLDVKQEYNEENCLVLQETINWYLENKMEIAFKYGLKIVTKDLIMANKKDGFLLRYLNSVLESQYGLNIVKDKEDGKTVLKLKDKDSKWDKLTHLGDRKIIPREIKSKGHTTNSNDYDTSGLDQFIDI
jgi:hypothetical protein